MQSLVAWMNDERALNLAKNQFVRLPLQNRHDELKTARGKRGQFGKLGS